MRDKFEADEDWYWCCHVDCSDGMSEVAGRYHGGNKIYFRVGDCYFDLWKCPK